MRRAWGAQANGWPPTDVAHDGTWGTHWWRVQWCAQTISRFALRRVRQYPTASSTSAHLPGCVRPDNNRYSGVAWSAPKHSSPLSTHRSPLKIFRRTFTGWSPLTGRIYGLSSAPSCSYGFLWSLGSWRSPCFYAVLSTPALGMFGEWNSGLTLGERMPFVWSAVVEERGLQETSSEDAGPRGTRRTGSTRQPGRPPRGSIGRHSKVRPR